MNQNEKEVYVVLSGIITPDNAMFDTSHSGRDSNVLELDCGHQRPHNLEDVVLDGVWDRLKEVFKDDVKCLGGSAKYDYKYPSLLFVLLVDIKGLKYHICVIVNWHCSNLYSLKLKVEELTESSLLDYAVKGMFWKDKKLNYSLLHSKIDLSDKPYVPEDWSIK